MAGATFDGQVEALSVFAGNTICGGAVNLQVASDGPAAPLNPASTIIPFRRDPKFVPRGDYLSRIHQLCSIPASRVALSQIAIEFAHQLREQGDTKDTAAWVFWVHASTRMRIEEGFKAIADALQIPGRYQANVDIMQLVYHLLSDETKGRWYIILDSADNPDVLFEKNEHIHHGRSLVEFLPQSRNGSIIVTTRNREVAYRLVGDHNSMLGVGAMTEIEAVELLENRLGSITDKEKASDLVKALDRIPLAVSQAGAYIQTRAPQTSLEKYLTEFRESERARLLLLTQDLGDLRRDGGASNVILTSWRLSFNYIRSKRPSAADLLSLMSFFNPQGIPLWLLKPSRKRSERESKLHRVIRRLLHVQALPRLSLPFSKNNPFPNTVAGQENGSENDSNSRESDLIFREDVAMLRDHHLISPTNRDDMVEMHGLVQLSTRAWLESRGLYEEFRKIFTVLVTESFPAPPFEDWDTCGMLLPHVEAALAYLPQDKNIRLALFHAAVFAANIGSYNFAERILQGSMATKDTMGLRNAALVTYIYSRQNQLEKAEILGKRTLDMAQAKLGAKNIATLEAMNSLAIVYDFQGRREEAVQLREKTFEGFSKLLGEKSPHAIVAMANLATSYGDFRETFREAEELGTRALGEIKVHLGSEHPFTFKAMAEIAKVYSKQSRWEAAQELLVTALEGMETKLGSDHIETLDIMGQLASTYRDQSQFEKAEELQLRALEGRKNILGPEHSETLSSMSALAVILKQQGRQEEALALMNEFARIHE